MNEEHLSFVLYYIKNIFLSFTMHNEPLYTGKGQFCFDHAVSGQW